MVNDYEILENYRQCKNYDIKQELYKLNLCYVYGKESVNMCAYRTKQTEYDRVYGG